MDKIVKSNNKNKKNGKGNSNSKWIITIIVWTILISGGVSLLSDMLLRNVNILVAFIILIFIISIGVIFDIIGVAVTAAEERPFHARASKKVPGAKIAVKLIRNADKVSNLCNDVVGDVCGIISGTTGAVIVAKIMKQTSFLNVTLLTAIIGALIAALTIGGKAWGKSFAIKQSEIIIDKVSKIIYIVKKER
ncbi:hypothetical protein [Clostridium cochlearium]|uniref:Membrane spanning protein n=1 Tax=Clostridium cochlearium TaxID=1494 RepID=A0A240A8S6_CLOCO|nr:hypothetical protein [Clostridium cochlearium]MBV1816981.1 hypothetical protein [Bacteroidales bacterium MSK.15.36]MBE6065358.1 hypothetical protein [Clostridium cochlearium]SDL08110.1 hypothetical protein SAMN05216497_106108 [Clostridium cochlearium]SNV79600.1 membrane spanning protein [Clostridium cochlearium]SQB32915.1 membrane spanning protein [Clostridium cochlearium]